MCFSPAGSPTEENFFSFLYITESFVLKQLKGLKTNNAIGLDRISGRLLRDSADCIAPVLTRLFNRSLQTSAFPAIWKQGKVTALFKAGEHTDCNNYRPITVLPTISNILERAVHIQLYGYLYGLCTYSCMVTCLSPNCSPKTNSVFTLNCLL